MIFDHWTRLGLVPAGSFLLGLWSGAWLNFGPSLFWFLVILASASFFWRRKEEGDLGRKLWLIFSLIFLGLALGVGRLELARLPSPELASRYGTKITLSGVVISDPQDRGKEQQAIVQLDNNERLLLSTNRFPVLSFGQKIIFSGKLVAPSEFVTGVGREFDYPAYLAQERIVYQMSFASTSVIGEEKGFVFNKLFSHLRSRFKNNLEKFLPAPESTIAGGVSLGLTDGLDKDLKQKYQKAGLSHILVLSGYNLTILIACLFLVFGFLPLWWRGGVSVAGIFLLIILSGGGPAVWRAGIMALLALGAMLLGRLYQPTRALFLSAVVLAIWQPLSFLVHPGFWLSFLATTGVIFGPKLLTPAIEKIGLGNKISELISTTISAQIAVTPLILYLSGLWSWLALPLNLVILPLVPFEMFLSLALGILGGVVPPLGWLITLILYPLLWVQLWLVEFVAKLDFFQMTFVWWGKMTLVVSYLLIIWWYWFWQKRKGAIVISDCPNGSGGLKV